MDIPSLGPRVTGMPAPAVLDRWRVGDPEPATPHERTIAKITCGTCGGRGSKTEKVRRRDTCNRCGGSGQKRTGKVTVPCSGCKGAGGFDRTSEVQVGCRTCGGKGYR